MESLALLVVGISLAISLAIFIPLLFTFRSVQKRKFPSWHGAWYILIVPLLLVVSYAMGIFILVMISRWNG